jgi:ubiquinone/menaquinone biosynthesis C-methylase UbiE
MKSLNLKPNIEFLKNTAKSLRSLHQKGDPACCEPIRIHDISFKSKSNSEILKKKFSIIDAQRIVAREYGYPSWATLKHFIESLDSPLNRGVSDKLAYHQKIVASFDKRSLIYDKHVWARENSIQTVDYCLPELGNSVLDIATGTGTIAFYAAELVGPTGSVTGIEISKGMLKRCDEKLKESTFKNVSFLYADAEDMNFSPNSFDRIYCSSALYWMTNPLAALRHWFELLKPGGQLGFNAWPDNLFLWGDGARQALRKYGINFTIHEFTGNLEKTRELVTLAGFSNIKIHEVKDGQYVEAGDGEWVPLRMEDYTPGQYPNPISNVTDEILKLAQKDYEAEVRKRTTKQGIWLDKTMYYVYGQKL